MDEKNSFKKDLKNLEILYEEIFNHKYSSQNFIEKFGRQIEVINKINQLINFEKIYPLINLLMWFSFAHNKQKTNSVWFNLCDKSFMSKVNLTTDYLFKKLNNIKLNQIKNQQNYTFLSDALGIVDCTPFKIPKPSNLSYEESKQYWCDHYYCYCWKFQLIVRRNDGYILHVSLPFPGSISDIEIFRYTNIFKYLDKSIKLMGDTGYLCSKSDPELAKRLYCPYKGSEKTDIEKEANQIYSSIREIIEHTNERIHEFKIIPKNDPIKMNDDKRFQLFWIICNIHNISLEFIPVKKY